MAVWQYDFAILPEQGILHVHGHFPDNIEAYRAADLEAESVLDREFPDYWSGVVLDCDLRSEFREILPPLKSWSEDALMYGTEDGNKIEYWNEGDIECRIDMRNFTVEVLMAILRLAKRINCKIIPKHHGRILNPELDSILEDIKKSKAFKFVKDPMGFLKNLSESKKSEPGV